MKILTKKYRVIFDPKTKDLVDNPFYEYNEDSNTYVGEGREGSEFDTMDEVESYMQEKGLKYEHATEN